MVFNSIIFFLFYLLLTSISFYCLTNLFTLNTTFKILFNALGFILSNAFVLILLGLDFLGIVYAVVYAGAILVLFLSVLMLVDLRTEDTAEIILTQADEKKKTQLAFLHYFVLLIYVLSLIYVYAHLFNLHTNDPEALSEIISSNIPVSSSIFHSRNIIYWMSEVLYTSEVSLLLIVGSIFLLAMIGSVSLILNEFTKTPAQHFVHTPKEANQLGSIHAAGDDFPVDVFFVAYLITLL